MSCLAVASGQSAVGGKQTCVNCVLCSSRVPRPTGLNPASLQFTRWRKKLFDCAQPLRMKWRLLKKSSCPNRKGLPERSCAGMCSKQGSSPLHSHAVCGLFVQKRRGSRNTERWVNHEIGAGRVRIPHCNVAQTVWACVGGGSSPAAGQVHLPALALLWSTRRIEWLYGVVRWAVCAAARM